MAHISTLLRVRYLSICSFNLPGHDWTKCYHVYCSDEQCENWYRTSADWEGMINIKVGLLASDQMVTPPLVLKR